MKHKMQLCDECARRKHTYLYSKDMKEREAPSSVLRMDRFKPIVDSSLPDWPKIVPIPAIWLMG